MSLDLTILLATPDRAEVLRKTLEAMCNVRRDDISVELVVVDNGSSDHTSDVLRELATQLPLKALFEPNPRKCHALNRELERATLDEVVVFTDDDVTPDPSWFEAIVSTCARWPEYSVFDGRIDVPGRAVSRFRAGPDIRPCRRWLSRRITAPSTSRGGRAHAWVGSPSRTLRALSSTVDSPRTWRRCAGRRV
jgi:glycosyltransferase involved in cell wall biosynthesis